MATQLGTVKDASSLALRHRAAIKNGDLTPFIPAFAFALAKDSLIDMLTATILAAVVTEFLGLFISVYLFIFLWGKGKWKVRLLVFILGCFDSIPAVSLIPFSTVCVAYAYWQAKNEAERAKIELTKLEVLTTVQMTRQYQMAEAVRRQSAFESSSETAGAPSEGSKREVSKKV